MNTTFLTATDVNKKFNNINGMQAVQLGFFLFKKVREFASGGEDIGLIDKLFTAIEVVAKSGKRSDIDTVENLRNELLGSDQYKNPINHYLEEVARDLAILVTCENQLSKIFSIIDNSVEIYGLHVIQTIKPKSYNYVASHSEVAYRHFIIGECFNSKGEWIL